MNIFSPGSREFKIEARKMRQAARVLRREVKEINRIAKQKGISPKYVKLNEENTGERI